MSTERSNARPTRRVRHPFIACLAASLALVACARSPEPATPAEPSAGDEASGAPAAAAPAFRELEEEASLKSPGGATFEAPAGWYVADTDGALRLQPPERDLDLWLVDVRGVGTDEAIAEAWARVKPSFDRAIDDAVTPPAQGGWDEVRQVTYATAAEESRGVIAIARKKGEMVYVALLDGPVAALQRRGAHINQIVLGQKPGDLEEESFAEAELAPLDEARRAELHEFIERARETLDVPGAAVAVVREGEVVFERGYGTRGDGAAPVTPETAFMIGSTTKSLTSLLLAVGVERGAFSWSTPVRQLLPAFSLGDAAMAEKLELQHSMCACTGLPRQDMEFLFEFDGVTPKQRLGELAKMEPTTGFGETFQYSNALVSAGGYAAARALAGGGSLADAYRAAMREAVFEPLGMGHTGFVTEEIARGDHALPYGRTARGAYERIPLAYEDAVASVAPAGGAWSTARDLARYVALELGEGALPSGERFVSGEALLERRKPRVQISDDAAYGLALMVSESRGLQVVGHGGNTLGFTTHMNFFPEHGLGLVVLANAQGANAFSSAIQRKLVELVLGGRPEAEERLRFAAERAEKAVERAEAKLSDPLEDGWAEPLLGRYENDALGQLEIRRERGGVVVDAGEWAARAERFTSAGSSTLMVVGPPVAGLSLLPQDDGALLLDVGQQRYVFARAD